MTKTFRDQRLDRGWRLRDLSAECAQEGVPAPSTSHLSQIERGRVIPRPPLRAVLARLLDLPGGVKYFEQKDKVSA
jgi:transcriptional regulator with XRE-family HTH domain